MRAVGVPASVEGQLKELARADLDPLTSSSAECALGLLSRQRGEFDSAGDHFSRSIAAAPNSAVSARAGIYWAGVLAVTGEFDEAANLLSRSSAIAQPDDLPLLELQRGVLADASEHFLPAVERYSRAIELAHAAGDTYIEGLALNNRASIRQRLGNLDAAEFDLRSLLVDPDGDARVGGLAQHNLGSVLSQVGAIREAIDRIDRAGQSLRATGTDRDQAVVAEMGVLLGAGLFRDCLSACQEAVHRRGVDDASTSLTLPSLLVVLGRAMLGLGLIDGAAQRFKRAHDLFGTQSRRVSERDCSLVVRLLEGGEIPRIGPDEPGADAVYEALIALGDHDEVMAPACWTAAVEAVGSARTQMQVFGHYARARLLLERGDVVAAKTEAMVLIEKLADHTADINAVELRAALVFGLVDVEGLAVRIGRAGDPADLACLIDQANTVVHSIAPLSEADTELVAQLDELRASIRNSDPARIDRTEVALLEGRLRSLHRRMERNAAPTEPSTGIGIEQLSGATCEQTLVMFAEVDTHLWRLVLPSAINVGDGATLVDLGPRDSLTSAIRRVRHVSDGLARRPSPIPSQLIEGLDRRARELDALLFADVGIDAGTDVILFPGRFLTSVPWRVLPSAKNWRVGINAGTPLVCPGPEHRRVERPSNAVRALIVAGPDLGEGIAVEISAVAAMYDDPIVLTGEAATVSAVLAAFEEVDIAHVAGHGSLHAKDPLMAMITLADGPLTVYDIEMATATPPTVVLASCLVGSGGSTGSDVSYGFASAMASRGTRQLIISPVELDDDKTALVMPELHRALAAGTPARIALDSLHFEQLDLERVADSLLAVEAHSID